VQHHLPAKSEAGRTAAHTGLEGLKVLSLQLLLLL